MELRYLRYFVAVAEECHFGRAAERLHIAQPALSQQIKKLETELGVVLLHRSTRRVELTPAGERYLERVRSVLVAVDDAGDEAVRVASGETGRLAIGFAGSATYELLPTLARSLQVDLPQLRLDLHGEMMTLNQVDALLDRTLDVAFVRPPVVERGLEVRLRRREPLIAAVPQAHPLADRPRVEIAELREEPFITYPESAPCVVRDATIQTCRQAGFTPFVAYEADRTATLISYVAAGMGVALVPASVRYLNVTGAVFRPLAGRAGSVELAAVVRAGDASPSLRRFLDWAGAFIPAA